ncbi:MAG: SH3 domain-containing protein [Bacteroidetes bacterium]|nr:SH3 domain-containing protein [Bacteroidota bacterium]
MKKIVFIIAFFLSSSFLFAEDNATLLSNANKEYSTGQYNNAIELYQKIIKSGYASFDLYYNLASSYFKVNNYPSSILFYEKANKLKPNDENVNYNLKVVNNKIVDKIEAVPDFFLKRWWNSLVNFFPSNTWAVLCIISFFIFFIIAAVYLLANSVFYRKSAFYLGIFSFFFTLFFFAMAGQQKDFAGSNSEAIIFNPTVSVKSSPDENSTDIFVIHEGTKVKVTDDIGDWYEIKIANGSVGWMKSAGLEKI